ncbi:phosphoribosyltransferase-like protein [Ralstonia pseudosolanacearum]|uniref:phosphoribosyltransferase-like protein n=1 Tax=Ralstonia pseudosolanacearum TaxID=1310165 RepID=UPI0013C34E78|nr:hypothetical protein [Ralstonia pseudosolanacearum]
MDNLQLTQRYISWISQFDQRDQPLAESLARKLTLVSHTEFERKILRLIESEAQRFGSPVALYAIRELDKDHPCSYFTQVRSAAGIDAVGRGADIGSEGRIAAIIRSLAKAQPERYINHPDVEELRKKKARGIFVVDDIIGSGTRARSFLDAIWRDVSIRSWRSRGLIKFSVISYSATPQGIEEVTKSLCLGSNSPEKSIRLVRACPTMADIFNEEGEYSAINGLCKVYGKRTSKPGMSLGYKDTMAMLVFEHGCPNNTPSILWAPKTPRKQNWNPLFPNRVVPTEQASAFSLTIDENRPDISLISAGETQLAASVAQSFGVVSSSVVVCLALAEKGMRSPAALSFATGLTHDQCIEMRARCESDGLLTKSGRLTSKGLDELRYARRIRTPRAPLDESGEDYYYPRSLRSTVYS